MDHFRVRLHQEKWDRWYGDLQWEPVGHSKNWDNWEFNPFK